jgi:DNA-binding beta-propeller fold protein YncE
MRRAVVTALASALLASCHASDATTPEAPTRSRVGSSIVLFDDARRLAVVDPDHGSVSIVDAATLEPTTRIEVGGEPHALLAGPSSLRVTSYRGGELVDLDPRTFAVVRRTAVCAGAWGLAASADDSELAIACEWENAVVRLDAATLRVKSRVEGLQRPRALAYVGDDLVVIDFTGGRATWVHPQGSREERTLVPKSAPARPALQSMNANLASAILPALGDVFVSHELVNNTGDATKEKIADDYGSVVDGNPKINPVVTPLGSGRPPIAYATYDAVSQRAFNGPSALATYGGRFLLVTNLSSNDVARIDLNSGSIARFVVGAGPRGVAVDESGHCAFVDNAFDGSVTRLDLDAPDGAPFTRVRPLPSTYSPSALAGRKIFHDATNAHVTPAGVVACATCHPDGGDDGLVWFAHTSKIPLKRRRTPHLANAKTGTAPFHWNGEFATMNALVRATMSDLMAGDGLLVDVDAVQAFVDEIVRAPVGPTVDVAGEGRGRALFEGAAGCAGCHSGPHLTDTAMHAVLSPVSLQPDDVITTVDTPGLHGVFLRAPYFHDGRARDLSDLLQRPDAAAHGDTAKLTDAQREDLLTYLRSL